MANDDTIPAMCNTTVTYQPRPYPLFAGLFGNSQAPYPVTKIDCPSGSATYSDVRGPKMMLIGKGSADTAISFEHSVPGSGSDPGTIFMISQTFLPGVLTDRELQWAAKLGVSPKGDDVRISRTFVVDKPTEKADPEVRATFIDFFKDHPDLAHALRNIDARYLDPADGNSTVWLSDVVPDHRGPQSNVPTP